MPSGARARAPARKIPLWLAALPILFFGAGLAIPACTGQTPFVHFPLGPTVPAGPSPLHGVKQLVIVVAHDWDETEGLLQTWERNGDADAWRATGSKLAVALGRNGLGWGRGLHAPQINTGPQAKEGDGRAPAGAFPLGPAFGFAAADEIGHMKIPYLQERATTECIDDPRSRFYNMIVDHAAIQDADWNSSEQMAEQGDTYRWGIVIRQNDPPVPGGGSCLFVHGWTGKRGTAGCTGLEPNRVQDLMRWLDPDSNPVLVQLPRSEYERVKKAWDLPVDG
jgi:hypothetical protein